MEIADSDKDGVLTFEEFMHAHGEMSKRKDQGKKQSPGNDKKNQEYDDLPDDY
jgi:hypothetical protein